jgi:SAM-dependent methyltransferase
MYDIEPHIAEIYDQVEAHTDDVALIQNLIGERGPLRILEPFCGTGRILIPLAMDGHHLVGIDRAQGMLVRAQAKVDGLWDRVRERIALIQADVLDKEWPRGFDLILLAANCFYELATAQEQKRCIASAFAALESGGYVYIDNDHMEGDLDESWQRGGVSTSFPTGTCSDGTHVESTVQTIWYDAPRRLARFCRRTRVSLPNGNVVEESYVQQKHPVSTVEVRTWLEEQGFFIEQLYGDRARNPYVAGSPRAIFWAGKP